MDLDYLLESDSQDKNFYENHSNKKSKSEICYSPGEKQKLRLLDLLADDSKFLLLDEPTSHLDIKEKEKLIENLHKKKTGFIIISHDRDFISKSCDRIFELSNGKLEDYKGDYKFYLEEKEKREKFIER